MILVPEEIKFILFVMKKRHSATYLIIAFIFAQFAWMGLLGLWIYWYVTNYLIIEQVGDKLAPQIVIENANVWVFVGGIILIICVAVAMFFFFRNFSVQFKLTKLYDNFIANVTHELKSPLSSIQLYLETLMTRDVPKEKTNEFIDMMIKDAKRLNKLINTILELSRLEQKQIAHDYHVYNAQDIFSQLIKETVEQFRLPANAVRIAGSADCQCVIDQEAIGIVLDNLTDNAMKYSVNPVEIEINFKVQKKYLHIEFTDRGIGINSKEHKKVFNQFHRVHDKSIPNVKGTGLGLYWVKGIIKLHGGRITLNSEGRNKGTTIIIELPVYKSSKKFYINALLRRTAKQQRKMETSHGN
ncbi:MAG: HAMP domain-containing sensor histidine kinase [bacterium]